MPYEVVASPNQLESLKADQQQSRGWERTQETRTQRMLTCSKRPGPEGTGCEENTKRNRSAV